MGAPPLIHYLTNVKRWIWILYLAGFVSFLAIVFILDAMAPLGTPAGQLVTWENGWLFLIPAALVAYGFYVGARYWRCPQCKLSLPTKNYQPIPAHCRRCGYRLRG